MLHGGEYGDDIFFVYSHMNGIYGLHIVGDTY